MGGALWVAPAIQTVNMTRAWAAVGSGPGDPGDPPDPPHCYSVDIDIDRFGVVSYDTDTGFRCLSPQGAWSGAHLITATSDGAGGWIVTIAAPGASITQGFAKARDKESEPACRAGTSTASNAMHFAATNANGKRVKVRDVELTFCLPVAGTPP